MGWFDRKESNKGGKRMTKEEVEAKVRKIVIDTLDVPGEKVVDGAMFDFDLGADELDCVELIVRCEESLGVMISEEESESLTTFGKLVDCVAQKLA